LQQKFAKALKILALKQGFMSAIYCTATKARLGPISKAVFMTFTRTPQVETSKVSNFIVEAITITVLALSGLLGLITIASA
jgi:hypothetical protein